MPNNEGDKEADESTKLAVTWGLSVLPIAAAITSAMASLLLLLLCEWQLWSWWGASCLLVRPPPFSCELQLALFSSDSLYRSPSRSAERSKQQCREEGRRRWLVRCAMARAMHSQTESLCSYRNMQNTRDGVQNPRWACTE